MNRRRIVGGVAIMIGAVALVTWGRVRDSGSALTAAQLVRRSQAAQASLAGHITAGTTVHSVRYEYYPGTPLSAAGAYPVHTKIDEYIVFGADGKIAAIRTIESDDDTDQIFATVELVDGVLIDTDIKTGETEREPGDNTGATAQRFAAALRTAPADSSPLVDANKAPRTATVEGIRTYVIERNDGSGHGSLREYYDASTYREVKSETLEADGSISRSDTTVVFEILPGEVLPTPVPVVATAIAGDRTVAAEPATPTPIP